MLDCLVGYIGLKNCPGSSANPYSGLFINSLPGISLESIDKLADSEQLTYKKVWEDIQKEATSRFYVDVVAQMHQCFQLNKDCDYEELICGNDVVLTQAWKYLLGNQTMLERIYSTRINRFTTVDAMQARELLDHYQIEYELALKQAVQLMDITFCEMCCDSNPQTVTWLP